VPGGRRRRRAGRGKGRGGVLWFLAGAGTLVIGLAVAAEYLDETRSDEPARSLERSEPIEPPAAWDRVRVEVLNAGGVPGVAATARDLLRDRGFDVVHYGNAPSFGAESSTVLARTGSSESALAVAGVLGVGDVRAEPDSSRFADVTVLLGSGWDPASAGAAGDEGGEEERVEGAWWDLRRLLGR
jgi:hypothetical protein